MPYGPGTYTKPGRPKKKKKKKGPITPKKKKWDILEVKQLDEVMVRKKLGKGLVNIQSMELL